MRGSLATAVVALLALIAGQLGLLVLAAATGDVPVLLRLPPVLLTCFGWVVLLVALGERVAESVRAAGARRRQDAAERAERSRKSPPDDAVARYLRDPVKRRYED